MEWATCTSSRAVVTGAGRCWGRKGAQSVSRDSERGSGPLGFRVAGLRRDAGAHSSSDQRARVGTPTTVMQVLKQRVSRAMHGRRRRKRAPPGQVRLWDEAPAAKHRPFWQRRFYDFNVWTRKKRNEKINYMHFNPVKRELVKHPKDWLWSSYGFYLDREGVTRARRTRTGSRAGSVKAHETEVAPFEKRRVRHPLNVVGGP